MLMSAPGGSHPTARKGKQIRKKNKWGKKKEVGEEMKSVIVCVREDLCEREGQRALRLPFHEHEQKVTSTEENRIYLNFIIFRK